MSDIITFYKHLLATGRMRADNEGFVSKKSTSKEDGWEPAIVEGKRLVIPTANQTALADTENRMYFHPLCESALKGESATLQRLRRAFAVGLNYSMAMTFSSLIELAASHADHAKLDPDQSEILSPLHDSNADTAVNFLKIVRAATIANGAEASLVQIYLKRNAVVGGANFARGATVSFPVYEELLKNEEKVFDVKLSKKDRATLIALFEYTLPGIKEGLYNQGSNSDVAPYLDSLLKAVGKIGANLNHYSAMYKLESVVEDIEVPLGWYDDSKNLDVFLPEIRRIPQIGFDSGSEKVIDNVRQAQTFAPNDPTLNKPVAVAPFGGIASNQQTMGSLAPAPVNTGAISFAELKRQQMENQQRVVVAPPPAFVLPPVEATPLVTDKGLNFGVYLRQQNMQQPQQFQQPQVSGWNAPRTPNYGSGI